MSTVIKVENLSKRYRLGVINRDMLYKDLQSRWARFRGKEDPNATIGLQHDKRIEHGDEFWALRNVDLEVKEGEILGIIGRNGAGKSTLLKILSQITAPTEGKIKVKGRIASLLEVGTGFHPELTGRENVFLNGAILGMTRKEVASKFDEIVAFAEIDEFIDTPVKRYSSGMYVRLAFAVAAHLEPEILVVDEVLAVGDASFQKKCLGKMKDVSGQGGRTVLFVSHNMTAVQSLCSRAVLMKNGQTAFLGDTEECVRQYLSAGGQIPAEAKWEDAIKAPGNDRVRVVSIRALSMRTDGQDASLFDIATPVDIEIRVRVLEKCTFHPTLHFQSEQGITAFTSGCLPPRDHSQQTYPGEYSFVCRIPKHLLNEGVYCIRLLLVEDGSRATTILDDIIGFDVKDLEPRGVGSWHGREPGQVRPHLEWTVGVTSLKTHTI
jgi:lipopolysaccharide transport system ATP-binding protein